MWLGIILIGVLFLIVLLLIYYAKFDPADTSRATGSGLVDMRACAPSRGPDSCEFHRFV